MGRLVSSRLALRVCSRCSAGCAASLRLADRGTASTCLGAGEQSLPVTVTLLTHDSFAVTKTLLSDFEAAHRHHRQGRHRR